MLKHHILKHHIPEHPTIPISEDGRSNCLRAATALASASVYIRALSLYESEFASGMQM